MGQNSKIACGLCNEWLQQPSPATIIHPFYIFLVTGDDAVWDVLRCGGFFGGGGVDKG